MKVRFNMLGGKIPVRRYFRNMLYLVNEFNLEDSDDPELLVYDHPLKRAVYPNVKKRLFSSTESIDADWSFCDAACSWRLPENVKQTNYIRLTSYVIHGAGADLIKSLDYAKSTASTKTKFCAFVYSNGAPQTRKAFFNMLSKYKHIDSPGSVYNNMAPIGKHANTYESRFSTSWWDEKVEFFKPYKFVIAFENEEHPGYTDEKIYHAMKAGCIPIYWGNPKVHKDFNSKSFIHPYGIEANTKAKLQFMVDQVEHLDSNTDSYMGMLGTPWYYNNRLSQWVDPKALIEQFKRIFS